MRKRAQRPGGASPRAARRTLSNQRAAHAPTQRQRRRPPRLSQGAHGLWVKTHEQRENGVCVCVCVHVCVRARHQCVSEPACACVFAACCARVCVRTLRVPPPTPHPDAAPPPDSFQTHTPPPHTHTQHTPNRPHKPHAHTHTHPNIHPQTPGTLAPHPPHPTKTSARVCALVRKAKKVPTRFEP